MTVAYLADAYGTAALAGRIVGALVFPMTGLVLLIIGIRKRSVARKQAPPGYPPTYPGPGQAGYELPQQPPRPRSAGTGFIVAGVILLVVGALGIVGASRIPNRPEPTAPSVPGPASAGQPRMASLFWRRLFFSVERHITIGHDDPR